MSTTNAPTLQLSEAILEQDAIAPTEFLTFAEMAYLFADTPV
ncbi:hypothetical protein [Calothrix sp. PCC 7507]|nr:hypothetical protein [Calothrix sp. PCC 7507]AFY30611.1 hypothetical protein Cal7507_0106 [Calothrix sp. PCC 7507]